MDNNENCTNKKYIWVFLRKYKIIAITLAMIPLILGIACCFSLPYFNSAGSAAWLGFWGGYLGSTIMACITLYVLDKQLSQNHIENLCNAVLQIATLTNNEEKAHIDKLAEALAEFQISFDYLTINQVAERMLKKQFLSTDVDLLKMLIRDVDSKGFKVDILLKPIPNSKYINEYNAIYNNLYNGYGLLITDFMSFINLMRDIPEDKKLIKAYVLQEIKNNKIIEANILSNVSALSGFNKPKSIYEIIEENKYYEDLVSNSSQIIKERLVQSDNQGSSLKESLKTTIINLLDYEYKCINENFNEKIKIYSNNGNEQSK